jgi:predicted ATPase
MPLKKIKTNNYHSIANLQINTNGINVLFGPNGSGKSTFLDAIKLIGDCAVQGVDIACSDRNHGIGTLWDGAEKGSRIVITLETDLSEYEIVFGLSSGRIEPFVGEKLTSKKSRVCLIERIIGSKNADFFNNASKQMIKSTLRTPEKLSFTRYLNSDEIADEAVELDHFLNSILMYSTQSADIFKLKKIGSEQDYNHRLSKNCDNLWSVLRNIHDSRSIDDRYDTIISYMKKSFPAFKDLYIKQTGPNTVYGHFLEKSLHNPILASWVSDGYLHMLILLTILFSEEKSKSQLILFDEPETSLHPHALSVFAEAVKMAYEKWNRQIFIATHSPVLISQFEPEHILAVEKNISGETVMKRLIEMTEIKDLLEEYAAGSLYMAEMIAAQSISSFSEE